MKSLVKFPYPLTPHVYRDKYQLSEIYQNSPELWNVVYHIGDEEDFHEGRVDRGYFGISKRPWGRFEGHRLDVRRELHVEIHRKKWTIERNMFIVAAGTRKMCQLIENSLRPIPMMGLNKNPGGKGNRSDLSRPEAYAMCFEAFDTYKGRVWK